MKDLDQYYMQMALEEASLAFDENEIPIGAVIVYNEKIIARGHNLTETLCDVTAHAEMQVITSAANYIGGKYLTCCTLYVTLEPCIMCAGAIGWAHLGKLVYGASDSQKGFTTFYDAPILHQKTEFYGGILEKDCAKLLNLFFKSKR